MKNNKIISFLAFSIFSSLLLSCNNDEDNYENTRMAKPSVTINTKSVTIAEGNTVTFTLTIDKPIANAIDYKIELVNGSTGGFRDYVSSGEETSLGEAGFGQGIIGHKIVFPATSTTATFTITAVADLFPESTETLKIRLSSSGNGLGLVSPDSEFINVTVTDTDGLDFSTTIDHSGFVNNVHGTPINAIFKDPTGASHEYCELDLDIEIYNAANVAIAAYYDTCNGVAVLPSTSPDGTYRVVVSFYSKNGIPMPTIVQDIPLKVGYGKQGIFYGEANLNGRFKTNTVTTGAPPAVPAISPRLLYIFDIVKVGTVYTVKDSATGNTLISG